jgi:hypothetical protein
MPESIKIVAFDSQFVMWEAKPVADVRVRARKLFLFYTEKSIMQISFALFPDKAKASEAFLSKISLALENSHQ